LGAAHALTPGHGKALVAAYLVGSKGTIRDAIYLGSVVTATHTASVFVLGLGTLYASQHVSLDRIYPVLNLLSSLLVLGIGVWLLWQRTQGHTHRHDHGDGHHHHGHGGHHHHETDKGSLLSLGISGGMVPCPEAMVVLMLSISLRKLMLGMALLTAFTLGLAAILIAIGCVMVLAGSTVERMKPESGLVRKLPLVSAGIVTLLGAAMVVQALLPQTRTP
jgi:ABC-type nickel/cobalt efflux system permease component RcnA